MGISVAWVCWIGLIEVGGGCWRGRSGGSSIRLRLWFSSDTWGRVALIVRLWSVCWSIWSIWWWRCRVHVYPVKWGARGGAKIKAEEFCRMDNVMWCWFVCTRQSVVDALNTRKGKLRRSSLHLGKFNHRQHQILVTQWILYSSRSQWCSSG